MRSTLAAETLSLQDSLETGYYYRGMLEDILGLEQKVKTGAYVDNRSVIETILSTRLVGDKRIRIDIAAIKELVQLQEVNRMKSAPGHLQLANSMTKQGASGFSLLKVLETGQMIQELYEYF